MDPFGLIIDAFEVQQQPRYSATSVPDLASIRSLLTLPHIRRPSRPCAKSARIVVENDWLFWNISLHGGWNDLN